MSKNFDETKCLQSEKRKECIREIRGKRLQGIAEARVALLVWPAYQLRRSGEKRMSGDPL